MDKYYSIKETTLQELVVNGRNYFEDDSVSNLQVLINKLKKVTVKIKWLAGYLCAYAVGSNCAVSPNDGYIISDIVPVEYGKKYTLVLSSPIVSGSSFRWVGTDINNIVTEVSDEIGGNATYTWAPTLSNTVGVRIRSYSTQADALQTATELVVA
ncbi:MAG: hypothetical protein IKU47_08420 [Oscillospiraceae bacterium]|nr:hypothetical protein [Oscillospiraceae bacterium]